MNDEEKIAFWLGIYVSMILPRSFFIVEFCSKIGKVTFSSFSFQIVHDCSHHLQQCYSEEEINETKVGQLELTKQVNYIEKPFFSDIFLYFHFSDLQRHSQHERSGQWSHSWPEQVFSLLKHVLVLELSAQLSIAEPTNDFDFVCFAL